KIDVLLTVDGVNFKSISLTVGEVFGKILGNVFCDGIDVTKLKCSDFYADKILYQYENLSLADISAVQSSFGFDQQQLLAYYNFLTVCKWSVVVNGPFFSFEQSHNNSYVNVACLMLQHINLKFNKWQWQEAWYEFRAGRPHRLVALVLAKGHFKFDEPSDATDFIRVVLKQADLSGAICELELICDCGIKQESRVGVDAVMHFGTLAKTDLFNGYKIGCNCAGRIVHCTKLNVPFLICSNTPLSKDLPDDVVAANMFMGVGVGHYTHLKCGSPYQHYDACSVKKYTGVSGCLTDCLYLKNLTQTFTSML
uniref:Papain-like protease n=1 Tax=Human coronavirus HKU1 TaxID=290028 RepID=UPI0022B2AC9F|nr:Chain A, Papain-like protease [Human coronavirus HKU1]